MNNLWETASKGVAGVETAGGRVAQGAAQVMAGGKSVLRSAADGAEGVASSVNDGARLVGSAAGTTGRALQQAGGALNNLSLPYTAEAKPKSKNLYGFFFWSLRYTNVVMGDPS